jgi:hypothetical protein
MSNLSVAVSERRLSVVAWSVSERSLHAQAVKMHGPKIPKFQNASLDGCYVW